MKQQPSYDSLIVPHPIFKNFVPLPSDPKTPLTPEQLAAVFGGDVELGLRELAQMTLNAISHDNTANQPMDHEQEYAENG